MTPRERLLCTLKGQVPDRVPVFTHIPVALTTSGFKPGPFHGYQEDDHWREQDPAYVRLAARMAEATDHLFTWRPPCLGADAFFCPPSLTTRRVTTGDDGRVITTTVVKSGRRRWESVAAVLPGTGHTWVLTHFCKSPDDACRLLELPWERPVADPDDFAATQRSLGDRGLMWVTVVSPLMLVCRLFDPTAFCILVRTEPVLLHSMMEVAALRTLAVLRGLLDAGVGPIIRFGGAEHATPPLMGPADFDDLVVRYDQPLMDLVKRHGHFVSVHCHGRIRHALQRFVTMGVDQTDPVETVPDGDLTIAAARKLAQGQITLTGNIQMRELYACTPAQIRERVRQLIAVAGPDRLIITATGAPLQAIAPAVAANYHAMIDATHEYGVVRA